MTSRTRKLLSGLVAGILLATGLVQGVVAQETENLGTHRFWTAWKGADANGVICYVSSQPQTSVTDPAGRPRGEIHFLIIHRKGLGTRNEVQTLVGYPLGSSTTPQAVVDGRGYDMVIEGEAAWLASTADEDAFVEALKRGTEMVVRGTSTRGTNTTDTYSLSGVTAAMDAIDAACA
jgi:hypothetical protein